MKKDIQEVLIKEEVLHQRVKELAAEITVTYQGKSPVCIGILKGSVPFFADLTRAIALPLYCDYMAVSSYGQSTKSSGTVKILKDLDVSLENKDVIVVEDIIDTGLTLQYLLDNLRSRCPASLAVCTLLNKPSRRLVDITPDYNGFNIADVFVVGYGLDYAEKYRNLPFVGVLREEIYSENSLK